MPRHVRWTVLLTLLILLPGLGVMAWWRQAAPAARLQAVRQAVAESRFKDAIELSRYDLQQTNPNIELRVLVGHAFRRLGRFEQALNEYQFIPDDGTEFAIQARWESANIMLDRQHRPFAAASELARLLAQDPHHGPARVQQAALLGLCGRTWEANGIRLDLVRDGLGSVRELTLLGLDDLSVENLERLNQFREKSPSDPITRMADAYAAFRDQDLDEAQRQYAAIVAEDPEFDEAQVRLGSLLLRTGNETEFLNWHDALPPTTQSHPDLWEVRGDFARSRNDMDGAARCYWEAVRRNPTHRRALHRLGMVLTERNEPAMAALSLEKAEQLLDVQVATKRFHARPDRDRAREVAPLCSRAGLDWEAWGWALVAHDPSASPMNSPLPDKPADGSPRMNPDTDVSRKIDLSHLALPAWIQGRTSPSNPDPNPSSGAADIAANGRIAFEEISAAMGIDFVFHSGDDLETPEQLAFQFTGGGVAVLDYDGDHWPDLFLTQGNDWPTATSNSGPGDALFRNLGGNGAVNVAAQAGIADLGYGQGVTVGDIDNDGFPDLFVANIEGGRLYLNHGDGTFADITVTSKIIARDWTTSCLLADLNGDGNSDLYLVNYLQGNNLYQTVCRGPNGEPRGCTPYDFSPAQDALWISTGDGSFADATTDSGIVQPGGNGLGIAAISNPDAAPLNLFVANDTTANFWFTNTTAPGASVPTFDQSALISGLAFDRDGRAQGCMGVAVGDADGDGRIDLFVTNFHDEPNTLYLQTGDGFFDDATAKSGLREPSLKLLGFGTQFIDADLDGWLDLVLTNGHVNARPHGSIPSAMPPQFFRNLGQARYVELKSETAGSWFAQPQRGRGLARLDWNRDGREEFAVSHLDARAALLRNVTQGSGNFVSVTLVGTRSPRDAIGTTVRMHAGGRTFVRQLTAGDGYQASNQRQLNFGIGDIDRIDRIDVIWPSGMTQALTSLPLNAAILLIEGSNSVHILGN